MNTITHNHNGVKFAEIITENLVIDTTDTCSDLMANMSYQGFDGIILHEKNISADFFELKNGMAGELLQKFSNFRMKLLMVGDWWKYESKSIRDFMFESNKRGLIVFAISLDEAFRLHRNAGK